MKKLTADKCKELINKLTESRGVFGPLALKEDYYLQALEIALPVLEQQENKCEKCNGTGHMDSGGTQPWGESILATCDCQPTTDIYRQIENDGWIEWGGGECPVAPWEAVSVKHRNDKCTSPDGPAYQFDWSNYPSKFDTDIIAYRVIENDGWIEWGGGECPVAYLSEVQVKYRDGCEMEDAAGDFSWTHDNEPDDIIAYRVIENDGREE